MLASVVLLVRRWQYQAAIDIYRHIAVVFPRTIYIAAIYGIPYMQGAERGRQPPKTTQKNRWPRVVGGWAGWVRGTGEARDMEPQGPGVRAAGGPAELQGIWGAAPRKAAGGKLRRTAGGLHFFGGGLR
jgi:hypothetical protein